MPCPCTERDAAATKLPQLCLTVQPQRRQPTRLPCPWDPPGKNSGVGCHFLLQCMKVKSKGKSLSRVRLLATPWTAAYEAPPSIHGIFQARVLEWGAIAFSGKELLKLNSFCFALCFWLWPFKAKFLGLVDNDTL